jgi:hypothetical protein
LPDLDALARAVDDLRQRVDQVGRDPASVTIQLQGGGGRLLKEHEPAEAHLEWLANVEAAGANQLIVEVPPRASEAVEGLVRYGEEVIVNMSGQQAGQVA